MDTAGTVELTPAPTDGVRRVRFSSHGMVLLCGWSGEVSIYDGGSGAMTVPIRLGSASACPVLDAAFLEEDHPQRRPRSVWCTALDGTVSRLQVDGSRVIETEVMETPALELRPKSIFGIMEVLQLPVGLVVCGSYDGRMLWWDAKGRSKEPVANVIVPGQEKVFAMTAVSGKSQVVVGTSGKRLVAYDVRKSGDVGSEPVLVRGSPVKHQIRCIASIVSGAAVAIGSTEGRVAVEYLDEEGPSSSASFTFRCHRDQDLVFPVNAIDVHPRTGAFVTAGCDGTVCVWDAVAKKRITQLGKYSTSVSSVAFEHEVGERIAIAVSYTFEEGEKDHPPDRVLIRAVRDDEVRSKAMNP